MTDIKQLDINIQCARVLGWTVRYPNQNPPHVAYYTDPGGNEHLEPPRFATSPSAVLMLEDEIERRRLQAAYVIELSAVVGCELKADREQSARHLWMMIRATPEQRCRAFLKAVENDTIYTIDVELPEVGQGNPPLATTEDQNRVIADVLPLFNPPQMDTILELLHAGRLTTECAIDGIHVSFVLRPVEEALK